MSIKVRLFSINILLVLAAVAVGVVLYNIQEKVNRSVREVHDALEEIDVYKDMKMTLLNMAIDIRNIIFDPNNEEFRKELDEHIKKYMENLRRLNERTRELSEEEAELTRILGFFTYQGDLESIKQLLELEAYDEAKETLLELEKAGFEDTVETLDRLIEIRQEFIASAQEELLKNVVMARTLVIGITVPTILLVSALLWFVSRSVIKQINTLSSTVDELARNMRFRDIKLRKFRNELDRLVEALEVMVRDLGSAVNSIKDVMMRVAKGNMKVRIQGSYKGDLQELSNYINSSLSDLQKAIKDVKEGLLRIASSINVLTEHAGRIESENENLNSSIASIMTSVDETSEAVRQISEETLRARNISLDMERAIQNGKSKVDIMHAAMGNIVDVSKEISSITETIINIAEQTNLLALNAAIEAARAGEMGRGFAVVADEVRRLAEISGNAAKEIASLVEKTLGTVEEGKNASEDVVESYKRIEEVTREIASVIDTIATAMEEQSRAIDIIRDNMTEITQVSEKNTSSIREMVQEIRNIKSVSVQVEERMKGFEV